MLKRVNNLILGVQSTVFTTYIYCNLSTEHPNGVHSSMWYQVYSVQRSTTISTCSYRFTAYTVNEAQLSKHIWLQVYRGHSISHKLIRDLDRSPPP